MCTKYIVLILFLFTIHNRTETPKPVRSSSDNLHVFSSCYDNLGCIDLTEKWYDETYRPTNLEPLDRHTIRTEFLLLKEADNSSDKKEIWYDILSLKPESVNISGYKQGVNTIFLIHDFTSNGHTGWIKHITMALIEKIECNVISVDWEAGAEPPFDQAIANARVVGLELHAFIIMLKNCFSLAEYKVHLIGHGIGAHIAGYAGKSTPGIGRITGLDPTGPRFEHMPPVVRLDFDDAIYVEVLHTDAFNGRSQGTIEPMGHADFYLNNAQHQPGCEEKEDLPSFTNIHRDSLKEGAVLPACSHKRSFKYYINAIVGADCKFVGVSCPNYNDFLVGNCTNCKTHECATFGLTEPTVCTPHHKFYLVTDTEPPYCLHTYIVNITIDNNPKGKKLDGYFEFMFVDEDKKVTNATGYLDEAGHREFAPGEQYTLVAYTSPPKINQVQEAKVKWVHNTNWLEGFSTTSIFVKQIQVKRVPFNTEKPGTSVLCADGDNEIKNNGFVQFVSCASISNNAHSSTRFALTTNYTISSNISTTCRFTAKSTTPKGIMGTIGNVSSGGKKTTCTHGTSVTPASIATGNSSPEPEFENVKPLSDEESVLDSEEVPSISRS